MDAPTKAFVWAAGLGTRLRPYTLETPKPMMPVFGRPMIEYVLRYLAHTGVESATVNTWHLAEQFEVLPDSARGFGLDVHLSRQPQRFEHAGDLAYAQTFLDSLSDDDVFIGLNGDTLFYLDPSLIKHVATRLSVEHPVLLLVHRTDSNPLKASGERLVGIGDIEYATADEEVTRWDDFGVKLFHSSIRDRLPTEPQTMSFHGNGGLLGRMAAHGLTALVVPVEGERAEIGTVQDYEEHESNETLGRLADRLLSL